MSKYKGYTAAQNVATQKYLAENMEQLRVWIPKGKKSEYKSFAESRGKSLAKLVVELLEKEIEKDGV